MPKRPSSKIKGRLNPSLVAMAMLSFILMSEMRVRLLMFVQVGFPVLEIVRPKGALMFGPVA